MVPYFKALNYIYLQDRSAAQVEARRASLLLSKYVDATLSGVRDEDGDELRQISNNAFLHYYSGMLYDWDGEINDAFTAYRNAAVAYQQNHDLLQEQIPPSLGRDLDRVAKRLGFPSGTDRPAQVLRVPSFAGSESADLDLPTTRQDYEEAAQGGWQSGHGEVVLLIETGFVPKKTQVRFDFPIFESETYDDPDYWGWEIQAGLGNLQAFTKGRKIEYWVTVAAPELQDEPGPVGGVRVSVPTLDGHAVGHPGVESAAGGAHHLRCREADHPVQDHCPWPDQVFGHAPGQEIRRELGRVCRQPVRCGHRDRRYAQLADLARRTSTWYA